MYCSSPVACIAYVKMIDGLGTIEAFEAANHGPALSPPSSVMYSTPEGPILCFQGPGVIEDLLKIEIILMIASRWRKWHTFRSSLRWTTNSLGTSCSNNNTHSAQAADRVYSRCGCTIRKGGRSNFIYIVAWGHHNLF